MPQTLSRPDSDVVAPAPDALAPSSDAAPPLALGEPFANRVRWTRDVCDDLERYGFLPDRYELIDGAVISQMGHNQPHAMTITLFVKWLYTLFAGEFILSQVPVEIAEPDRPNYYPLPDAAVIVRPVTEFPVTPPGPGDIRLVAEVSDSTLRDDLTVKAGLYARAGFPEYWVLDVTGRRIVVHRAPVNGVYGTVFVVADGEEIACEAAPDRPVSVAALFEPLTAATETSAT